MDILQSAYLEIRLYGKYINHVDYVATVTSKRFLYKNNYYDVLLRRGQCVGIYNANQKVKNEKEIERI